MRGWASEHTRRARKGGKHMLISSSGPKAHDDKTTPLNASINRRHCFPASLRLLVDWRANGRRTRQWGMWVYPLLAQRSARVGDEAS